ncbi:hypothetical protein BJ508DRAFT_335107 [Ascobolus immersus RN42]|uniref:Uncharacterized protein n=1 Tax=Ascobolus immersus RN42 TaxID=1160509 RepID=A0A3N4HDK6_ASCIM|nr:hypothetical protein BJ508DRAFT_335107 [Ascobolus immersus RN42]
MSGNNNAPRRHGLTPSQANPLDPKTAQVGQLSPGHEPDAQAQSSGTMAGKQPSRPVTTHYSPEAQAQQTPEAYSPYNEERISSGALRGAEASFAALDKEIEAENKSLVKNVVLNNMQTSMAEWQAEIEVEGVEKSKLDEKIRQQKKEEKSSNDEWNERKREKERVAWEIEEEEIERKNKEHEEIEESGEEREGAEDLVDDPELQAHLARRAMAEPQENQYLPASSSSDEGDSEEDSDEDGPSNSGPGQDNSKQSKRVRSGSDSSKDTNVAVEPGSNPAEGSSRHVPKKPKQAS